MTDMMSPHEHEQGGCGCRRCAQKSDASPARLVRTVADALENDTANEAEFLAGLAAESGGLRSGLGALGGLWHRLFGGPKSLPSGPSSTFMRPPPPSTPPGPPYDQPIPKPPKLPANLKIELEAAIGDAFEEDSGADGFGGDGLEDEGFEDDGFTGDALEDDALEDDAFAEDAFEDDFDALEGDSSDGPTPRLPHTVNGIPPALRSVGQFDGYEAVIEAAIEEDELEAAAPVLAGLAIKRLLSQVSAMPPALRQRLVAGLSQAVQAMTQQSGAQGARAAQGLLQSVGRVAQQKGLPAQALAPALQRLAPGIARRPDLIARFAAAARSAGGSRPDRFM
jgi:hypothetical protein